MEDLTKEEIKELVLTRGLDVEKLIDVVVDINAIIGVGLVGLGNDISMYTMSKAQRHPFAAFGETD